MPIASTVAALIPNKLLLVAVSLLIYFSFIAFLVGSYLLGSYLLHRFSMDVREDTKVSPLKADVIHNISPGAQKIDLEFDLEGQFYRCSSRQVESPHCSPRTEVVSNQTNGTTSTGDLSPSIPSLGTDEGTELSSEDIAAEVVRPWICPSSSSTSMLTAPRNETSFDAKPWYTDIPEIRIEECEDPEPSNDDIKNIALSAALSATNLNTEFLSVPPRSCFAPRESSQDEVDEEEFSESSDDSSLTSILNDFYAINEILLLSTGSQAQNSSFKPSFKEEKFHHPMSRWFTPHQFTLGSDHPKETFDCDL